MATNGPQTLGATLRTARLAAGLSLRQLAKAAGINHSYLVKLETDQNDNPSAAHLQRLADVLEIDASDLLSFIGVEPSSTLPSLACLFASQIRPVRRRGCTSLPPYRGVHQQTI